MGPVRKDQACLFELVSRLMLGRGGSPQGLWLHGGWSQATESALGSPRSRHTMLWHREDFLLDVQVATSPAPPSPAFGYQSESRREVGQEANVPPLAASVCL